jgi:hypothetical protein
MFLNFLAMQWVFHSQKIEILQKAVFNNHRRQSASRVNNGEKTEKGL